jgi:hypothetical protein
LGIQSKLAQPTSNALNASLIADAEYSSDTMFLGSPLIGGAVGVTRFQKLFLKSIKNGRKTPAELAADAFETKVENISALLDMAVYFQGKRLPIMKAPGIVQ